MVACTFVSAPLMFVSAKMISITNLDPKDYLKEYINGSFDLSVTSICAAIFVLLIFIVTKKFKRLPHRMLFTHFTSDCIYWSYFMVAIGAGCSVENVSAVLLLHDRTVFS